MRPVRRALGKGGGTAGRRRGAQQVVRRPQEAHASHCRVAAAVSGRQARDALPAGRAAGAPLPWGPWIRRATVGGSQASHRTGSGQPSHGPHEGPASRAQKTSPRGHTRVDPPVPGTPLLVIPPLHKRSVHFALRDVVSPPPLSGGARWCPLGASALPRTQSTSATRLWSCQSRPAFYSSLLPTFLGVVVFGVRSFELGTTLLSSCASRAHYLAVLQTDCCFIVYVSIPSGGQWVEWWCGDTLKLAYTVYTATVALGRPAQRPCHATRSQRASPDHPLLTATRSGSLTHGELHRLRSRRCKEASKWVS